MYQEILPLLSCPCCKKSFSLFPAETENEEITEGYIECEEGHRYPIRKGVLHMGSEEQADSNTWSDYYQDMSYEELDKALDEGKTENQKKILAKFLEDITAETGRLKQGFLLDIASGRGLLLSKLIETAAPDVHIIASDLSFTVLMYDRLKFAEKNMNMGSLFEAGVAESARVLKKGAPLIHASSYLDPESAGYREVEEILKSMNAQDTLKNLVRQDVLATHSRYFSKVSDTVSYEGIAEGEEADLLPRRGSWFANVVIRAEK